MKTIRQAVMVKGGINVRNGMWHDLRNDIVIQRIKFYRRAPFFSRQALVVFILLMYKITGNILKRFGTYLHVFKWHGCL